MTKPSYVVQYVRPDTPLRQAVLQWIKFHYPHHRIVYAPVLHNEKVLVSLVPMKGQHLPIDIPMRDLKRYLPPCSIHNPLASPSDD